MQVVSLARYPVKSMLGQRVAQADVVDTGLALDRLLGLVDPETGLVATAKHPRLWRGLLKYSAVAERGRVRISSPRGWTLDADDPRLVPALSRELGRPVRLLADRPVGSSVERPDPEEVLEHGVEAVLAAPHLEISQGTPGTTFVDYAPVHLITTATLGHLGTDPVRYRPNLVVETPPGTGAFVENGWTGREVRVDDGGGDGVVLRVVLPTPRCSVPTLEHGDLPRAPEAVRPLMTDNRVDVPGFGVLPCAGGYAEVVRGGTVHVGDTVTVA